MLQSSLPLPHLTPSATRPDETGLEGVAAVAEIVAATPRVAGRTRTRERVR